jgi:hypothetical protein
MSKAQPRIRRRLALVVARIVCIAIQAVAPVAAQEQGRDPWVVVESASTDKQFIAKILNREPIAHELAAQTRLLRVTWSYPPAVNGFPSEMDLRRIARIEGLLVDALSEGVLSKLVMSETGNGGRVWLFYVGANVDIEAAVRYVSLQQRTELVFSTVSDPAWNHLRDIRARLK